MTESSTTIGATTIAPTTTSAATAPATTAPATGDLMLGDRPGRGDFGLYGQLTQLVRCDPTSTAVAVDVAPKVVSWVERMDDPAWLPVDGDAWWAALDALDPDDREPVDTVLSGTGCEQLFE